MKVITLNHETIDTISPLTEGPAPDFVMADIYGRRLRLSALTKPVVISVFPDINTPVCSRQTRFFNEVAAQRDDIHVLSVSNNSPQELANSCQAINDRMILLPDDGTFGDTYGLRIYGGPMPGRLARSVYVIKNGHITYSEVVTELSDEPNYHAAINAANPARAL